MLDGKWQFVRAKDNMHRSSLHLGLAAAIFVMGAAGSAASSTNCVPPKSFQTELQGSPNADVYARLGNWYGDHKQVGCAIEAVRSGLRGTPRSAELFYLLGLNLMRKGDSEAALLPLQRSIELQQDVIKPHLLLAVALEQLHRPMEARKEWLAAVKIDPHSEGALEGASKNFLADGDYAAVIELLGAQPQGETLTLDLAAALEGYGSQDQASELLEKALQTNPSSKELTRALITLLVSQKRFVRAAELAGELVRQNPQDIEAQVLFLHVLVLGGDENQARPLAQKLLAAAPHNFGVLYLSGILENLSGNYKAARAHLEEAVKLNPRHPNCHFNLGITLSQLHDLRGAREEFEKALALGATEPQVRFEYAKVLRALGETKLAGEQLQLYQKEEKEDADRTAAAIKAGQADKELASGGDPQKAVALYREAIASYPDNAMLNFKLSVALDRVGDRSDEMEALKKAIQLDPQMAVAHYQLAYLAALTGDFVLAENEYGQAVKAAPAYIQAWIGLAATLATENRFSEAQQAVKHALKIDPKNANAIELQKELTNAAAQANQ